MRITDLTIRGYGIFRDCRVEDLPQGLALFLGDNEAGKSTFLGFIRDVLFGSPDGRSRERTYPSLRGGRWGGSLGLASRDWSRLLVDRGPGSKGGQLTLSGSQGEPLSREALGRALGGTTREVFKNVYAFSLSELQTLETLNSERVRDAVYSAGLGAGLSSLPEILKGIEDKRGALFKPGGQRQKINSLVSRLEQTRSELSKASGEIEAYENAARELESLAQENEELKQELSRLRARRSGLESVLTLWGEWLERDELLRELQGLPEVENFPDDGLKRYEDLADKLESLREQRDTLSGEMEALQRRIQSLAPDEGLLEREQTVRGLVEEKGRFVEAWEAIPGLESELKARLESLQTVIRRLGGGWTRERLLAFDTSLKVKEDVTRFAESLHNLESRVDRASRELNARGEDLAGADKALGEADEELAALKAGQLDWDEDLALELRRERDRFAQALQDAPALRGERDRGRREVERLLAEIDPSWSPRDLERFDTSLQLRERMERYRKELADKEREMLRLDQDIRSSREAAQELERKRSSLSRDLERLETPEFASLERVREAWSELQRLRRAAGEDETCRAREESLRDRISGLQREAESLREEPGQIRLHGSVALGGLLVCCLLLGLTGSGLFSWGATGPAAGLLGGLGLFFSWLALRERSRLARRRGEIADRRARLDEERQARESELQETELQKQDLEQEMSSLRQRLGLPESGGEESLEAELERARDLLQRWLRLEEDLEGLDGELKLARERTRDLEQRRKETGRAESQLRDAWKRELREMGLSPELEPSAAIRVLDRVETTRSELGHLRETEARLDRLESFMSDFAAKVERVAGNGEQTDSSREQLLSAVDRHLERVEQERERLKKRRVAEKEQERKAEEHSRIKAEYERVEVELAEAEKALEAKRREWRQWLEDAGLDPELTPDLAREALADVERAQGLIGEERELQEKLERSRSRVRDFTRRTRELARELNREEPQDRFLVPFLETLERELETSRANAGSIRELETQLREKGQALEETEGEIERLLQSQQELLSLAGAFDEEAFRSAGRTLERRQEISARLKELERALLRGTGQSDMGAVQELFGAWDRRDLEQEIPRLEQEIEDRESRRQEVSGRIGELRAEQGRLASSDDIARLRQEEESLREELYQAALGWSKHTLAGHLLRKAREKYEREQQPEVVRTAGAYLARITGGIYSGVFAPLGEGEVRAVDAEGQSRRPEELSRGTAEQLYLSLRFGYVDNAGRQGERLPVIMDDILVNFDRGRAENAAAAIAELAERNQVLYFSCHPRSIELFRRVAPEAPVFCLSDGAIRRCEDPPA